MVNTKLQFVVDELTKLKFNDRNEIPLSLQKFCKENNLLIMYGCSDDLLELRGAYDEEFGAYDGFDYRTDCEGDADIYSDLFKKIKLILTWSDEEGPCWNYSLASGIDYRTFPIYYGEEYSHDGIVVDLSNL